MLLSYSCSQPGCVFGDCPFLGLLMYGMPTSHSLAPFQLTLSSFHFPIQSTMVGFHSVMKMSAFYVSQEPVHLPIIFKAKVEGAEQQSEVWI